MEENKKIKYKVISLKRFDKQFEKLDKKFQLLIQSKVELLKLNPFRNKKLHSKHLKNLFRIRLNINKEDTRLIYTVMKPNIILICLLQRKKGYKELEEMLKTIK